MSDDHADSELLELLRQSLLGTSRGRQDEITSETGVLRDAEYIYNNAIDVSIDMYGTKAAATSISEAMQARSYSTDTWHQHELHPKPSEGFSEVDMVNFIFTMDLLNFSYHIKFWSELSETDRYQIEYRGKRWTGYNSLVACLRRALDDNVPITTPAFWRSRQADDEVLRGVFRSATNEEMPLLVERLSILREASEVLYESFGDPDEVVNEDMLESSPSFSIPPPSAVSDEYSNAVETVNSGEQADANEVNAVLASDVRDGGDEALLANDQHHGLRSSEAEVAIDASKDTLGPNTGLVAPEATQSGGAELVLESPGNRDPFANRVSETLDQEPEGVEHPPAVQPLRPDRSVVKLIQKAEHSAGKLVNLLAKHFPCFRDENRFDGREVRLLKRAQILVADLWAAFGGSSYGEFRDIDSLTMFADYRVPQMLHSLGVLSYSPSLTYRIRDLKLIPPGHSWEVQLRGCSIWAVELIRREILQNHPGAEVNAVLIDFFLYDLAKERERLQGGFAEPHHRTRSIWY